MEVLFLKDPNTTSTLSVEEIAEHLAHIKTVTLQKKKYGKQLGPFLVVWGFIWMVGFLITTTDFQSLISWSWLIIGIVGWLITFFLYFKQQKSEPIPTLLRTQLRMILIGCAFLVAVFSFLVLSKILPTSLDYMLFYICLLVSIIYVFLAPIFGKELSFIGIWVGILSMVTFTWFPHFAQIIYATIGGGSLTLSGLWLIYRGKDDE
jgi:hypothetical protein